MTTTITEKLSARDRLLAAANELFYAEGVHTVGIDRIIERAGVAKATLYSAFGSKEELIRAYLTARQEVRMQRLTDGISQYDDPRERLLAVFDVLGTALADPGYRGCAFMNASAESRPDSAAVEVSTDYRGWVRSLLVELSRAAGASDPELLARQLTLLYDGAGVAARMDGDPTSAAAARAVAAVLLDASQRS